MKNKLVFLLICLLLISCNKPAPTESEQNIPTPERDANIQTDDAKTDQQNAEPVDLNALKIAWSKANNEFGTKLLQTFPNNENALISPFSIERAMGMVLDAASGDTALELQTALSLPDHNKQMSSAGLEIENILKQIDANTILDIENRIWLRTQITDEYKSHLISAYRGQFEIVDFLNEEIINKKVEEFTHGRIKNLIPPKTIDNDTKVVLVNALYYKSKWKDYIKFEKTDTYPELFNSFDEQYHIQMMHNKLHDKGIILHKDFKAIELDFDSVENGADFVMRIVLPNKEGIDALHLAEVALNDLHSNSRTYRLEKFDSVLLSLPKFTISTPTIELCKTFQSFGAMLAFDTAYQQAHHEFIGFTEILSIAQIFHKAFIKIDEDGGEAATATAVITNLTGKARPTCLKFNVNRPFLFEIVEKKTNTVLFMGKLVNLDADDRVPSNADTPKRASDFTCEKVYGVDKSSTRAAIRAFNPEVTGGIDKRIIQKIMRQHLGELSACFEKSNDRETSGGSLIRVSWEINTKGQVSDASIYESTDNNEKAEKCVINAVKSWRFPIPHDNSPVTVKYPLKVIYEY